MAASGLAALLLLRLRVEEVENIVLFDYPATLKVDRDVQDNNIIMTKQRK